MFKMILGLSFCLLSLATPAFASPAEEAPQWLQQAAAIKAPAYDKEVPAVVLRKEQTVIVNEDGRITTTNTFAVRILTREGREFAHAVETYLTNSSKVREINAWLIRPNGSVKKYGKDQTVDRISDANDIYNEYRVKVIDASDDADSGVVFGYQSVTEDQPLFNQDVWRFQNRLPTLESRYRLTLPVGWRAKSVTFNHDKLEPILNGSTYVWELRDLSPIKPEPASPEVGSLAPRIAVNYFLPEGSLSARGFENWVQVSRWATQLHDPQAVPDEAVSAKARELTANSRTELERIKAIARFVQGLQYISIDIGIGRGNGYRPHAASQVLAKAYGDCKDKANLMRSLLKAINITAYPVAIYSGDATHVREEWASPQQFNHCIIAIKISDEIPGAAILQHATLGRLLIFDATDSNTPIGDLPEDEQGSFALLVAGEAGQLFKVPTLPPEASSFNRQTVVELTPEGSIAATVHETASGQTAARMRGQFRGLSKAEYVKMIEAWVSNSAAASKVSLIEPRDNKEGGGFDLDLAFTANSYAQLMQNRLLVFTPAIVSRRDSLFLTSPTRKHPVVLESSLLGETVRIKLPAGFDVDEMPDAIALDTAFGTYKTTYEVKNGELFFSRRMSIKGGSIPAEQYENVRKFYERIRAAEQSPVVLAKK